MAEESSLRGAGLLADPNVFPIGVWLQSPARAVRYRAAGFNLYVGLWNGPTQQQLKELKQAGMSVICHQNSVGLAHRADPTIVGWMHQDEPDNAQSRGKGKGYGPPVPPEEIVKGYQRMRAADPDRPVLLNLGQGVAWDRWHGRGVRTNHPEDYPQYAQGCDIASFDIYPVTHSHAAVSGKLWYVAQGVERLIRWTEGRKPVWNCIECTHINHPKHKPTPHQVRCEVWMSIIHGSTGLIYFVHEWKPKFTESGLLADSEMYAAVTRINDRVQRLAPVLNGSTVSDGATVESSPKDVPVAVMTKRDKGVTYVFAVGMRAQPTRATFTVSGSAGVQRVEVLDEARTLESTEGVFLDDFQPWDVHLYRIGHTEGR
ncbi:MAG: hypothetical protein GY842_05630 [bacterium]|nr:hypothetical protein [bacterium]